MRFFLEILCIFFSTMENFKREIENFKKAFYRNGRVFSKFHIHITFQRPISTGWLKTSTIHLPIGEQEFFHQHQTSIEIAGLKDYHYSIGAKTFDKILAALDVHDIQANPLFGLKIEGLVDIRDYPRKSEFVDFCYVEYHERFDTPEEIKDCALISYSPWWNQYYTAHRIYSPNADVPFSKYEVCVYDRQIVPFEDDWIRYMGTKPYNQK